MKKIIHPRLAAGTCFLAYLFLFEILEKITNIRFVSKHIIILSVLFVPLGIFVCYKFHSTYDKKDNDDKLFTVVFAFGASLFIVICFLF